MPLTGIIIDAIRQQGPLSFRDFMEMALYYPGEGYYASPEDRVGETGDFYTSPYLTQLFGEMIGSQLEEMWMWMDREPFTIVEYGAGTGLLCRDILTRLSSNPAFFDRLNYVIIEKSSSMRRRERELLTAQGFIEKVSWASSIRQLPPVKGCILSNELIDNFAVHQVVMENELMEIYVGYENGFIELLRPAPQPLKDYLQELEIRLEPGCRTEINLEATEWITEVSAGIDTGFVITIDYGNSSSALYNKQTGTLACYHKHQVGFSPYVHIGEQDITSHVNFSALEHWGRHSGLECCGYTSQNRFLQGLGLTRRLAQLETITSPISHRQLYTLLVDMGNKFKVLIQRKGLGRKYLSGLQFSDVLA